MSDDPLATLSIRNIAVATDFSPWSETAIEFALAAAHRFGAVLHVLHAVRRSEFALVPDLMVSLEDLAERDSADLINRLNATHRLDDIEYHCWNTTGEVSAVFEKLIHDHKIDLLVLGTHGRSGIWRLVAGSIAQQILHEVSCPALTIGPMSHLGIDRELKRVLFATDFSAESATAIPYVLTTARRWRAKIDVLHVCCSIDFGCRQSMEGFKDKMEPLASGATHPSIVYHILPGHPSEAVLNFAKQNDTDLIVLGLDHHRSVHCGPSLSHANEIVRQARCPVLRVRSAPAFAFETGADGSSA
jgi:nucleotide-binding universal stress UspA family protein